MPTKDNVLKYLKESDGFVSGEELSAKLNVSRTAVWKSIESLRSAGYKIDSVTNRGYKLGFSPDRYSEEEIKFGLETDFIAKDIYCFDSIDSTNNEAKRSALRGAPNGSLFVAEQQTGGKGRLGRSFSSPGGVSLYFSILLRPEDAAVNVGSLTLIAGLAVCEAIRGYTGLNAVIKWPNDVVIGSRKVCGILTEMSAEVERIEFLVVGIGVNVNNTEFAKELEAKATSLYLESGEKFRRIGLLKEILKKFEVFLKSTAAGNMEFLGEYKKYCVSLGRRVSFTREGKQFTGTAVNISPKGELIVKLDGGGLVTVFSGEVCVQGIYGQ